MPRIDLALHEGRARIKPGTFLKDRFEAYRDTCRNAGATFNWDLKANILELELVPILIKALQEGGFEPSVHPDLAAALKARAQAARKDLGSALERVEAIRASLKAQGLSLYPFQESGVAWIAPRERALLLDEMGLGKTIEALIAAPVDAPVVVVAPAAVKGVWFKEAMRWRPDLQLDVLAGRGSFRWPRAGEMVILNYDILPPCPEELEPEDGRSFLASVKAPEPAPGTTVIADEAHAFKSKRTLRTQRFQAMAKAVLKTGGRTWGLTGTPLLNKPQELWTIMDVFGLAREAFGTWNDFVRLFDGSNGYFGGYEWGKPSPAVAEKLKKVALRRMRAEVLPDLPTKTYQDIEVPDLGGEARDLADKAVRAMERAGIDLKAALASASASKAFGAAFEEMSAARAALASAKIPFLLDLVEEHEQEDQAVVVFSAHRGPVDALASRPGWAAITGDTPAGERTKTVNLFQSGALKGIALTIQAGGVGITLTRAHIAIFADLAWTPALNAQAEDRICRIGQDRGVIVKRLVADHALDQRVTELLTAKQGIISASVDKAAVKDAAGGIDVDALEAAASVGFTGAAGFQPKTRRGPFNALEKWSGRALLMLAANDPDRAGELNGVGFNKLDNVFGHKLAEEYQSRGGMTDAQWTAAVRLCRKYHAQVGSPPEVAAQGGGA